MKIINQRKLAVKILTAITYKSEYMNDVLNRETVGLEKDVNNYIYRVVYGTIENRAYLDSFLQSESKIKLKKLRDSDLNILRLALYEIKFMDSIPNYAAVDEATKLMKKSNQSLIKFTNGILRNISNNLETLTKAFEEKASLSVLYSHPQWMIDLFKRQFDQDEIVDLLISNNQEPLLSLRVNTLKTTRDQVIEKLTQLGFVVEPSVVLPEGVIILEGKTASLFESKIFKSGLFTVQDQSSMIVSRLLDPQPDEKILDCCASPGGKTTHIAQLMGDKGYVEARDISYEKLFSVKENTDRLGIHSVNLVLKDALEMDESDNDAFDRVLLDAPCSGLGIIRRKPDIKWQRKEEDISNLSEIQWKMINNASKYVKIGGVLVYSTCTITEMENELMIKRFLSENPNFELEAIKNIPEEVIIDNQIKIYPHRHGMDGFYACKLKRLN